MRVDADFDPNAGSATSIRVAQNLVGRILALPDLHRQQRRLRDQRYQDVAEEATTILFGGGLPKLLNEQGNAERDWLMEALGQAHLMTVRVQPNPGNALHLTVRLERHHARLFSIDLSIDNETGDISNLSFGMG